MAKERFTPGPWLFWEHKQIETRKGGPLMDMSGVCIPADGGNVFNGRRADAYLIAQTPDLLWALELIKAKAGFGNGPRTDEIHDLAKNAIRRATEEESSDRG